MNVCHVHRTHETRGGESAMEKVAEQLQNAHREWKPATVCHLRLTAGQSGHDDRGWPWYRVATMRLQALEHASSGT